VNRQDILKEEMIIGAAAKGGNITGETPGLEFAGKEVVQREKIISRPPAATEKQLKTNTQGAMVFTEAGYRENTEKIENTGRHSWMIQPLMQSVGVKRVPKTYAIPGANLSTAATGGTHATVKALKHPHHLSWSVGAFYRPEWQQSNMGRLENDRHDGPRNDRHAIRDQKPNISSYTTGLVTGLQFGNGLIIESGLSMFGQTSTQGKQLVRPRSDSGGGYKLRFDFAEGFTNIKLKNNIPPGPNDSVTITNATSTIRYIGIPLAVSYPFKFGKFYAIPSVGMTFQWLTSGKLEAQVQQGPNKHQFTENNINGLRNNFLSGQTGINLEYRITPGIRLQVAPTYRFSVSPVNKGAAVQYFPAAWGLGMGFRWILK
jgi:hypothetical protein